MHIFHSVLSDKERRSTYNQFGHAAFDGASGRGGFSNFDFSRLKYDGISEVSAFSPGFRAVTSELKIYVS